MAKRGTRVKSVISHSGKIARGVCVPLDQLYNLKTLNVTARMIDMALSNVLYELIDKSIPAKPLGHWEGKNKVREVCLMVPFQICVRTQRDIRKLGEMLNCRPCAPSHVFASNGTSAELLLSFFSILSSLRASEVPEAGQATKPVWAAKKVFLYSSKRKKKKKKKCTDNP